VSSSLPCIGPSGSARWPPKSRANTSTVNTRARRVRRVESASWCGSWPCAVRMMNASTPVCSQDPSRSFIQRCRVLRRTVALPAYGRGVAGLATAGLAVVRGPRTIASGLAALASLLLGVVVVAGVREVRRIECCWTEVRAELVPRDSAELRGALAAAVAEARRLAARGMRAALLPRDAAFEQLEVAMEARGQAPGVERGVVILGADGEPVAWAGRHRFVPTRDTVA